MPNECSSESASSGAGDLVIHTKMHSEEKSMKCNQCKYASVHMGHLRQHMETHNGEKSNKCNICGYASYSASKLRNT